MDNSDDLHDQEDASSEKTLPLDHKNQEKQAGHGDQGHKGYEGDAENSDRSGNLFRLGRIHAPLKERAKPHKERTSSNQKPVLAVRHVLI